MLGQHGEGPLGIELGEAMRQNRGAVVPGGEQRIIEAGDPGPFGRRPHHLVAARPVAEPLLHGRDATQHHAMGMQRALGLAGGARGVDQQGRILGRRVDCGEAVGRGTEQAVPVEEGAAVRAGADHDHRLQIGQAVPHRQQLRELAHVGDDGRGPGVGKPVFDRLLAEQREQRQHDGAHPVAGEMADRELGALTQEHRDPVALADATRDQRVGQPRTGGQQLPEGPVAHRAVRVLDDHRQRVGRMPFADGAADVEPLGPGPAELRHGVVVGKTARDHADWTCICVLERTGWFNERPDIP